MIILEDTRTETEKTVEGIENAYKEWQDIAIRRDLNIRKLAKAFGSCLKAICGKDKDGIINASSWYEADEIVICISSGMCDRRICGHYAMDNLSLFFYQFVCDDLSEDTIRYFISRVLGVMMEGIVDMMWHIRHAYDGDRMHYRKIKRTLSILQRKIQRPSFIVLMEIELL